nr:PREDICTED: uncharacterized protein LOC109037746 [Bemisia tabaci]XP_018908106.1 PREDICTED: uncharacterized protein LOC109037746 [Bemisia tabaci]
MPSCCVAGCPERNRSNRKANRERVFFHSFPLRKRSPERYDAWVRYCGRGKDYVPSRHSCICSRHFNASDYDPSQLLKIKLLKNRHLQGARHLPGVLPTAPPPGVDDIERYPKKVPITGKGSTGKNLCLGRSFMSNSGEENAQLGQSDPGRLLEANVIQNGTSVSYPILGYVGSYLNSFRPILPRPAAHQRVNQDVSPKDPPKPHTNSSQPTKSRRRTKRSPSRRPEGPRKRGNGPRGAKEKQVQQIHTIDTQSVTQRQPVVLLKTVGGQNLSDISEVPPTAGQVQAASLGTASFDSFSPVISGVCLPPQQACLNVRSSNSGRRIKPFVRIAPKVDPKQGTGTGAATTENSNPGTEVSEPRRNIPELQSPTRGNRKQALVCRDLPELQNPSRSNRKQALICRNLPELQNPSRSNRKQALICRNLPVLRPNPSISECVVSGDQPPPDPESMVTSDLVVCELECFDDLPNLQDPTGTLPNKNEESVIILANCNPEVSWLEPGISLEKEDSTKKCSNESDFNPSSTTPFRPVTFSDSAVVQVAIKSNPDNFPQVDLKCDDSMPDDVSDSGHPLPEDELNSSYSIPEDASDSGNPVPDDTPESASEMPELKNEELGSADPLRTSFQPAVSTAGEHASSNGEDPPLEVIKEEFPTQDPLAGCEDLEVSNSSDTETFVVAWSCLLPLFENCRVCHNPVSRLKRYNDEQILVVQTWCDSCRDHRVWKSQF